MQTHVYTGVTGTQCASYTRKQSRCVSQSGQFWEEIHKARPRPLRQARPQALLGPLPRRACLVQLGRAGVGQADQLLAPVLPGTDGDPAGIDQGAEVTGERRLVQGRQPAEIALAYLP